MVSFATTCGTPPAAAAASLLFHCLLQSIIVAQAFSAVTNKVSAKWTDLSDFVAPVVPPRSGHAAFTPLDVGNRPRVWGGYVEEVDANGNVERHVTNDMWEWDGADSGWTKVDQGGEVPRPRLAAAMALVNDRPVLFGGWDPQTPGTGGVILDTLKEFDPPSNSWSVVDARIPDGPSSRHVALSLPSGVALMHNHRCDDHVIIYSVTKLLNLLYGRFSKQPTTGNAPSSRGLHAATMAGDKAIIFGGAAKSGEMSNEAFALDTNTWEWKSITIAGGIAPCPRAGPCLCTISDNCVLLFGGAEATDDGLNPRGDVWVLHFDADAGTGQWELLLDDNGGGESTSPGGPPSRNAATLSEIEYIEQAFDGTPPRDGEIRKCFVLQGGWAPFRKTYNDCFVLSVSCL